MAEPRVVEASFTTRGQLGDALLHDLDPGGLFVAGEHDLTSGQRVQVLLRLEGIEPGLLMSATVSWRRIGRAGPAPGGTGVRFLPSESARFAWLLAVAVSNQEARGRRAPRFPVALPIHLVLSRASSVHAAVLVDVSDCGARLHTPQPPPLDQVVVFRLRGLDAGPPVPARVAWTAGESCGLEVLADRVDVQRFWDRFVAAARAGIDARVIPGARRH